VAIFGQPVFYFSTKMLRASEFVRHFSQPGLYEGVIGADPSKYFHDLRDLKSDVRKE